MNWVPGGRRRPPAAALAADEFAARFEDAAKVLWTLAAGVLGDRSEADDVLQEAALIGLRKREQFEPETSFVAWMGRIVRFVALNHGRRGKRRGARTADPEILAGAPARPADTGVEERFLDASGELREDLGALDDELTTALRELEPTARACLLLRTVAELDYREIAETLDIPEGTAMSHVHRSRGRLRERLEGPRLRKVEES